MARRQSSFTYSNSPFINEVTVGVEGTPGNITVDWSITAATADEVFAGSEALEGNDPDTTSITGGVSEFVSGAFLDTGEAVGEALSGQAAPYELGVTVTPRSFAALQNSISSAISSIAQRANIPEFIIREQLDSIPTPSIPVFETQTSVPVGETGTGSNSWSVPSVTIPVPQEVDLIDTLESLTDTDRSVTQPKLRITVQLPGDKLPVNSAQETFTVPVPFEAFIETRELDINCDEVYSDVVVNDISRVESRVSSLQAGAEEAQSQLDGVASELTTAAGTTSSAGFAAASVAGGSVVQSQASQVRDISAEDLLSLGTSTLQNLRTTVEQTSTRVDELSTQENNLSDIRQTISDEVGAACSSTFTSRVDDVELQLSNAQSIAESNQELRNALLDALSDIEAIDCVSVYSGVDETLNNLESRVGVGGSSPDFSLPIDEDIVSDVQSSIDSARGDVLSNVPQDSPCRDAFESRVDQVQSRLEQLRNQAPLNCAQEFSGVDQDISSLESRIGIGDASTSIQLPLSDSLFDSLTSDTDSIRDTINQQLPSGSPCADEFIARVDQIDNRLEQLLEQAPDPVDLSCSDVNDSIISAVESFEEASSRFVSARVGDRADIINTGNSIRDRVEDDVQDNNPCKRQLLNRVNSSLETITQVQRSCADVSNDLISAVSSFEGAVNQFRARDQLARLPEDKTRLINESEPVIDRIEDEVDDRNPCKSQLLSRVRESRSRLRAAPVRPESAIPCDQRYESVGERINDFEDRVLSLTAPVTPEEVQEIAQEGNALITEIEENIPEDSTCRVEMPERVRNLVERVRSLTAQVRIETEVGGGEEARRQELVDQLLGSIDRIENISGSGEDAVEEAEEAVDDATGGSNTLT